MRELTSKHPHRGKANVDGRGTSGKNTRTSNTGNVLAHFRDIEDVRRQLPRTLVQRRNLLPTPSSSSVSFVIGLRPGLAAVHILRARHPRRVVQDTERIGGLDLPRVVHRSDVFFWATPQQLGLAASAEWEPGAAGLSDETLDQVVACGATMINGHSSYDGSYCLPTVVHMDSVEDEDPTNLLNAARERAGHQMLAGLPLSVFRQDDAASLLLHEYSEAELMALGGAVEDLRGVCLMCLTLLSGFSAMDPYFVESEGVAVSRVETKLEDMLVDFSSGRLTCLAEATGKVANLVVEFLKLVYWGGSCPAIRRTAAYQPHGWYAAAVSVASSVETQARAVIRQRFWRRKCGQYKPNLHKMKGYEHEVFLAPQAQGGGALLYALQVFIHSVDWNEHCGEKLPDGWTVGKAVVLHASGSALMETFLRSEAIGKTREKAEKRDEAYRAEHPLMGAKQMQSDSFQRNFCELNRGALAVECDLSQGMDNHGMAITRLHARCTHYAPRPQAVVKEIKWWVTNNHAYINLPGAAVDGFKLLTAHVNSNTPHAMSNLLWVETFDLQRRAVTAGQLQGVSGVKHVLSEMWTACNTFRDSKEFYMSPDAPVQTCSYNDLGLTEEQLHSMEYGGGGHFFRELVRAYAKHGTQGDFRNTKRTPPPPAPSLSLAHRTIDYALSCSLVMQR